MKFLDSQHPIFKRLWVRVVTVVFPAVWAVVELLNDQAGWAILFFAASGYAAYELFYMYETTAAEARERERAAAEARNEDET